MKPGLFEIFIAYVKVGAMTFGGGYAMLPILEREVVEKKGWITSEEMMDYYAVGQSLPGIIAINVAGISGYKKRGILGGVVAALGVMFPCIFIITLIAALLDGFRENIYVQKALSGIAVCVVALILNSIIKLWKKGITDIVQFLIFLAALAVGLFTSVSPIICVIAAIVIGLVYRAFFCKEDKA